MRRQYRPLKTAPNLRHGWRLEVANLAELRLALDLFYPGRLAALAAWEAHRLATTPCGKRCGANRDVSRRGENFR